MNLTKLMKVIGYINIITNCVQSFTNRADKKRYNVFAKSFINTINTNLYTFKAVMSKTPEWIHEKSPKHNSYDIIEKRYNEEFKMTYTVYQHKKAKTQVISLGTNDRSNTNMECNILEFLIHFFNKYQLEIIKITEDTDFDLHGMMEHKHIKDGFFSYICNDRSSKLNAETV